MISSSSPPNARYTEHDIKRFCVSRLPADKSQHFQSLYAARVRERATYRTLCTTMRNVGHGAMSYGKEIIAERKLRATSFHGAASGCEPAPVQRNTSKNRVRYRLGVKQLTQPQDLRQPIVSVPRILHLSLRSLPLNTFTFHPLHNPARLRSTRRRREDSQFGHPR